MKFLNTETPVMSEKARKLFALGINPMTDKRVKLVRVPKRISIKVQISE